MANSVERIKANIAKNIREIVQFELNSEKIDLKMLNTPSSEKIDFLTITNIEVSSDHSYAKVYVSFFTNPTKNLESLNKVKGFVRSSLAKRLKLRRVPEISFVLDNSFNEEKHLNELLQNESNELKNMKNKK